jgi:SAM-dependent methyltransferase
MSTRPHASGEPSEWVRRWSHLVAPGQRVLDVACGSGRHLRWFAERGCKVTGVDRDADALAESSGLGIELVQADIENAPWPLDGRRYDAVIVTNYLWRALLPTLLASVDAGGVLLYETFAIGNERYGKPSNPNFLLRPGELLQHAQGLRVVAFEDGIARSPDRCLQRIAAIRDGGAPGTLPARLS